MRKGDKASKEVGNEILRLTPSWGDNYYVLFGGDNVGQFSFIPDEEGSSEGSVEADEDLELRFGPGCVYGACTLQEVLAKLWDRTSRCYLDLGGDKDVTFCKRPVGVSFPGGRMVHTQDSGLKLCRKCAKKAEERAKDVSGQVRIAFADALGTIDKHVLEAAVAYGLLPTQPSRKDDA